jgi:hypothetical protein
MPHDEKTASKTPMNAYVDGCPRHLDIDRTSDQDIQEIVLTTNLTPRKCLGFKTPFQALLAELGKDVQIHFSYTRCASLGNPGRARAAILIIGPAISSEAPTEPYSQESR